MITTNFIVKAFDQRWEEYRAQLKLCRAEFSEVAVHDLRVAARRLLAVLEIIQNIIPPPRIQKLRRSLKTQLDGFDDLRDAQVMLANISGNIASLPALEPFQRQLEKREKRLLRSAEKQVRAIKSAAFNLRMLKVHDALAVLHADDLPARLLHVVDQAYQTVVQRYGWIDPDQPATIHSVRIAFKKFRYMIECVHPILTGFPETKFKRMHDYQTMMGNIQDAEVFLQVLSRFTSRHPEFELEPVHHFYEQRFSQVLSIYLDHKGELDTFWRANPAAEQPWKTDLNQVEER